MIAFIQSVAMAVFHYSIVRSRLHAYTQDESKFVSNKLLYSENVIMMLTVR